GPAGPLQALIETPATEVQGPQPVSAFAVVCHPHPLHGGTLDNKVVYTVARALEQLGAPAIRFNFRGVGTSAGSYDEGRGETADALAVIAYGRRRWPQAALWLAGFSFGGAVAVGAAAGARSSRALARGCGKSPSYWLTIPFRLFRGMTRTFLLAGLALNIIFWPVNGLMPSRALVAGFLTTFIFSSPGMVNRPFPRRL